MKWWEDPLRISAVQCRYEEDSMSILKDHVITRHFNTEQMLHLFAEGHMATYNEEEHGRALDDYLEEAHKNNIRVIVYWNVHCVQKRLRDSHPSWIQKDVDGNELTAYDTHYYICINSEWFDYYTENLKALCSHDIDGIFLDGPVFNGGGCFCESCSKKFTEKYGKAITEASYGEMLEFKVKSVTEFIKKTNGIVKSIDPDILLYLNNSALRADVTGSNTREVEPYVDMLGAEGGFVWVDKNTTLWHASSMAKSIENQAKGKPTVIFIAGDHKPHSYYMHTAEETKILYAQSVSNGANVWYGIHAPTYIMDTPGGKAAIEFNKFLEDNEEYYRGTKSTARVALMWSMDSANYYSSSVEKSDFTDSENMEIGGKGNFGNHYQSFMGFYEILSRSHIQFDVIDEENIRDGSACKYDLIILPTCGCMEEGVAAGIEKFVEEGGKLLSTFDTGFFDERGKEVSRPALADVMGIDTIEEIVEYKIYGTGYMELADSEWLRRDISADIIPLANYAISFTPTEGSMELAKALDVMAGRYMPLSKDGFPTILHTRFGEGESVYIGSTIGEAYYMKTNPDHLRLIGNIVDKLSSPQIVTNAPGSVEMTIRCQKDRYILHMINMTGEMVRPIKRIIPLRDIDITLNIDRDISRIKCITQGTYIPFKCTNGYIEFTIPVLNTYDVFILE